MTDAGGSVACGGCGATVTAGARPDTTVPRSAPGDDKGRLARLEAQEGKPPVPPPGLESLVDGGVIPAHRRKEALAVWASTRAQLEEEPSDLAAAERLMFLVHLLRNTADEEGERQNLRGQLEASLEVVELPRFRQQLRCAIARETITHGALADGEEWLSGCDPYSEDIDMDSEYRIAQAMLDTGRGKYEAVLDGLGRDNDEIPIRDDQDPVAAVLRANAHERLGEVALASQLLSPFMTQGLLHVTESALAAMPRKWKVCREALPGARAEVRRKLEARLLPGCSIFYGAILIFAGCTPLIFIGTALAAGAFHPVNLGFLLFTFIGLPSGVATIAKALRRKRIAHEGLSGRGRVLKFEKTGASENDVPELEISLEVTVEEHEPIRAKTTTVMQPDRASSYIGREVLVLWHPDYPDQVVADL